MAESGQPTGASLFTVELRYAAMPRDCWELALVRARQLGANTIAIPIAWAWHALRPVTFDFDGATDPRRDLLGFSRLCARLGLRVALRFSLSAADAPPWLLQHHPEGARGYHAEARAWIDALTRTLLPLQFPAGPIAALHASAPQEAPIDGWLREGGWTIPIDLPASPDAARHVLMTLSGTAYHDATDAHVPVITIRPDGSVRPSFWRAKMRWILLGAAGYDFAQARDPSALAFDELDARPAWADGENIELDVRYGPEHIYLFATNRRATPYSGLLAYRAPDGAVLHLHIGLGAGRSGVALLRDDEVAGAAFDGEGSEGGWLARGLRTSAIFTNGAGGVAPCGQGLILTAPQSGRFQLRRADGWATMTGYRLLLSGELLPAPLQIDATHLTIPYVAEDERGQTDVYIALPAREPLPPGLPGYLQALLAGRGAALRRAAALAADTIGDARAGEMLASCAETLEHSAAHLAALDEYAAAWRAASEATRPTIDALRRAWDAAREEYLAGTLAREEFERRERQIARIIGLAAPGNEAM